MDIGKTAVWWSRFAFSCHMNANVRLRLDGENVEEMTKREATRINQLIRII